MSLAHDLVASLRECELQFLQSGQIAKALQAGIQPEFKSQTGSHATDIVTQADRDVQEAVLSVLDPLIAEHCTILAEETTPWLEAHRAPKKPGFFLTLDPVDGTSRFATGSDYYSLIVGLHDGRQPLYTFVYYPNLQWWIRLTTTAVASGPAPRLDGLDDHSRVIVYTVGDPQLQHPQWVARARSSGYSFQKGEELGPWGSKFLLLSGYAGGYYVANPNVYDGLFGYHYARARGYSLEGEVQLDSPQPSPRGAFYRGAYFAVREGLKPGVNEI